MRRMFDKSPAGATEVKAGAEESHRLNVVISGVLAVGLATAVLLLLTGGILALAGRGSLPPSADSIMDMPRALGALEPAGFFYLGLAVLLATPVARVFALAVGFAHRRSWLFCGVSVFVLALLALSAYLGLSG